MKTLTNEVDGCTVPSLSPLERELLDALREIRKVVYSSGFTAPELLRTRFQQIDLLASDAIIAAAKGK